jgi:hypothetical protein
MANKERKKRINEFKIALSNKEPKLKPLPKEKSQKEIEEENALHIKANNYNFKQFNHDLSKIEKIFNFSK